MGVGLLEIKLFGACAVRSAEPAFEIVGAKHKALFALLATTPSGVRTRSFLQECLWGKACYDSGNQSLRRALADIKKVIGPSFADFVSVKHSEIALNLDRVRLSGGPSDGLFLEGLDVREPAFKEWVSGVRAAPAQVMSAPMRKSARQTLDGPLVAVLPFRSLDGDPQSDLFGDWTAEEICRSLSHSHLFSVISILSARVAVKAADPMRAAHELLNAVFCLAGRLRMDGDRFVIDAQFVETATGKILWTRRFVARAAHFFVEAEAGVDDIVGAVGRSIVNEAVAYAAHSSVGDIEDHRLLVAGVSLMHRPFQADFARSFELLEEATRRAPNAPEAHAWLAQWHSFKVFKGWSEDIARDTQRARAIAARGLDLAPDHSLCLTVDGYVHNNLLKRPDIAATRYESALRYNPNESLAWLLKGALLAFQDRGEAAVEATSLANRLSPVDPFGYFYDSLSATAFLCKGDYRVALEHAERSLAINPHHISTARAKVLALYYLDRIDECRAAAREILAANPDFTVDSYARQHPAVESDFGRRAIKALRAAGIP